MGHKLLFVLGIVLAHGALAAGLASEDGSPPRKAVVSTCVRAPVMPLHISPPKELLAYAISTADYERKVMHQ
jgi:hypothetical protein